MWRQNLHMFMLLVAISLFQVSQTREAAGVVDRDGWVIVGDSPKGTKRDADTHLDTMQGEVHTKTEGKAGHYGQDKENDQETKRDRTTHLDKMQGEMQTKDEGDPYGHNEKNNQDDPENAQGQVRHKRTMVLDESRRWTKNKVPYVITESVDAYYAGEIARSMRTYERFTCLRFIPWVNESGVTTNQKLELGYEGYLQFKTGTGSCHAPLGNRRDIYVVDCCSGTTCMHELGHSLGMTHEAPSPDRDGWMRVNYDNIQSKGRYFYEPYLKGEALSFGYDYSSVMHYADWGFSSGGPTFIFLFPELHTHRNYYYVAREVSLAHKCQDTTCSQLSGTCVNDGYATLVDGVCTCRCLPGLDPETGCSTTMKTDPPSVAFPGGSYALPKNGETCPASLQLESSTYGGQDMTYCVNNDGTSGSTQTVTWTPGNYCIIKKGEACPQGFTDGYTQYSDGKLEFCCRQDGFSWDEMFLPSREAFALFKHPDNDCHVVRGTHVTKSSIVVDSGESGSVATTEGTTPVYSSGGQLVADVCNYQPAMIDCGEVIELNSQRKTYTFSSPSGSHLECVWLIKAPEGDEILLNFPVFDIAGEPGACQDEVEIRHARPGQPGETKTCGRKRDESTRSILNYIYVRLSTYGQTNSNFEAVVSLISEEDHCYKLSDHGTTYDGKVNWTRNWEPCLRWDEVTDCPHHAFNVQDQSVGLEENYCRTPDYVDGFRPWCYTSTTNCLRNYCDVCQLESVYDRYAHCESLQAEGFCSDDDRAWKDCAKTCQIQPHVSKTSDTVSSIQCSAPESDVPHAQVVGTLKQSYGLGENITYKCEYSSDTRSRTCLTSGNWSPLLPVCSECSRGWSKFEDRCYKAYPDVVIYSVAKETCADSDAVVATFKTTEEQNFVRQLASESINNNRLWMGLTDDVEEGTWMWSDGTPLTGWTNWESGQPNDWGNGQDCVEILSNGDWNDMSCLYNEYPFVCMKAQLDVRSLNGCEDVLDTCVDLLEHTPQMCDTYSPFVESYCAFTCGLCNQDSTPACNVDCLSEHVTIVDSVTSVPRGSVVEYKCKTGYVKASGNTHRACLTDGSLTGQSLVCVPPSQGYSVVNPRPFNHDGGIGYYGTSYTGANANFLIPQDGEVIRWEFYSSEEGTTAFQVWRHHPEVSQFTFEFVGQNVYQTPVDLEWKLEVPPAERIQVKAGDYIGVYYYYWNRPGILYDKCGNEPEAQNIVWREGHYNPDSFSVGTNYDFDPSTSCRFFTFRAIVGPVSAQ